MSGMRASGHFFLKIMLSVCLCFVVNETVV